MVTWHVVLDSVCDQGWMQVILEPFRSPACVCGMSACGLSAAGHSPACVSQSSENSVQPPESWGDLNLQI